MRVLVLWLAFCGQAVFAQSGFWDTQRIVESGIYASAIAADGWATQKAVRMGNFYEENPFARPFIRHGVPGQIGASIVGLAAGLGPCYLLYRLGHHKLSRIWLHVFTAGEAVNAIQMVQLVH